MFQIMKNFVLLFFITTFFSSCFLFKNVSDDEKIKNTSFIDSINLNKNNFTDISLNFLINYKTTEKSMNILGKYKNYSDSIIYISFSPGFGITLAEAFFSPDTAMIYSPLQKKLYTGNKDLLLEQYNIALNFYSIQSLFAAKIFPYPYFVEISDYKLSQDSNITLNNKIRNKRNASITDVIHSIKIDSSFNIKNVYIADYILNQKLKINYSNYDLYENQYSLPQNFNIYYINNDTTSLDIKIKNIKINSNPKIKFNVPANVEIYNF